MNFYRPVPCVSALSLSLRAALPLKDNHAGQFVLRGHAEWASREVKYQGGTHTHTHTHTLTLTQNIHIHSVSFSLSHTHTHTPLCPVVLNDLWPVHYPFRGDKCFWAVCEGEARMAALNARHCF